jgi:dihydrofolate synthase/folylpolyglutamate synthase
MNYAQTLDYLYSQLPMFHRIGAAAFIPHLGNTIALCELLGNPQHRFKSVHIAGTNGKGSSSHMIASVLQEAGYKTGLYTSPHLRDFRERIRINGTMIPEENVTNFVTRYHADFDRIKPSFFEMTVALAFQYFAEQEVDIAVIEVGMGGRFDSTNVIQPELSLITNIGFDHMQFLGDTLEKIAAEKAGIIKSHTPVVISQDQPETREVFRETAAKLESPLYIADTLWEVEAAEDEVSRSSLHLRYKEKHMRDWQPLELDLPGLYQLKNIKGVLQSIKVLQELNYKISTYQILTGLKQVRQHTGLMGRWQTLQEQPLVICDTGHNEDGIAEILKMIRITPHQQLHWVFGMVNDKETGKVLQMLPKDARYYFCKADIPRGLPAEDLAAQAKTYSLQGDVYATVAQALGAAKQQAAANDLVLVGGSTFVVAEVV